MANVVMVTAPVTAGIMHAMSSPNGGFIQVVSLAASMCSTACALSIAFAVMVPLACTLYPCVTFSLRWARAMPQERNARA
eukprot:5219985-Pleurochrysis_carterae.AAC.1